MEKAEHLNYTDVRNDTQTSPQVTECILLQPIHWIYCSKCGACVFIDDYISVLCSIHTARMFQLECFSSNRRIGVSDRATMSKKEHRTQFKLNVINIRVLVLYLRWHSMVQAFASVTFQSLNGFELFAENVHSSFGAHTHISWIENETHQKLKKW